MIAVVCCELCKNLLDLSIVITRDATIEEIIKFQKDIDSKIKSLGILDDTQQSMDNLLNAI